MSNYSTTLTFKRLVDPTWSKPAAITTVSPELANPFSTAILVALAIIASVEFWSSATTGYTPKQNAKLLATFSLGVTATIGHSGLHWEILLAVAPLLVEETIAAAFNSLAALQAALEITPDTAGMWDLAVETAV